MPKAMYLSKNVKKAARQVYEQLHLTLEDMKLKQNTMFLELSHTSHDLRWLATLLADTFSRSGLVGMSGKQLQAIFLFGDLEYLIWRQLRQEAETKSLPLMEKRIQEYHYVRAREAAERRAARAAKAGAPQSTSALSSLQANDRIIVIRRGTSARGTPRSARRPERCHASRMSEPTVPGDVGSGDALPDSPVSS